MADFAKIRNAPRIRGAFPVYYRLVPGSGPGYREAVGVDLSPEGVRFSCPELVPARSGFLVELRLPGLAPVRSLGRAAWVRALPDDRGFEVGGPFVEPSTAARQRIERYLQAAHAPAPH